MKKYQEELYFFSAILTPVFGLIYHRTRSAAALIAQVVSLTASTVLLIMNVTGKREENG